MIHHVVPASDFGKLLSYILSLFVDDALQALVDYKRSELPEGDFKEDDAKSVYDNFVEMVQITDKKVFGKAQICTV